MENIIEIRNLKKIYGKTVFALNDVNLSFPSGKIIGLLGPNGAGKTTLIKILTGLIKNYSGSVLIGGNKVGVETKKIVSYLPDADFIGSTWTVKYAMEYYGDFFEDFDREKALNLMHKLDIPLDVRFKSLSKGTREKVQLVLTLARQAQVYIFDEPIAGVDPAARDLIFDLILQNYNKKATIIISTHLISDAEKILDECIFIKKGQIVLQGNVEEIRTSRGKTIDEIFREEFKCLGDY